MFNADARAQEIARKRLAEQQEAAAEKEYQRPPTSVIEARLAEAQQHPDADWGGEISNPFGGSKRRPAQRCVRLAGLRSGRTLTNCTFGGMGGGVEGVGAREVRSEALPVSRVLGPPRADFATVHPRSSTHPVLRGPQI